MAEKIIVLIFGSMIGSFLNVCIYRLPLEKSVVRPRSFCPSCAKPIHWYDNIPILSYLMLNGRCRACGSEIPIRYLLVEMITALLFLALFMTFDSLVFIYYALLTSCLIVATFVDIQHRIIPDEISLGGIIAGLTINFFAGIRMNPRGFDFWPLLNSFIGVIVGGGILYITGLLFDYVYFKLLKKPPIQGETESMGGGDIKLLAMIGAFLGWKVALMTFFLAPFFGMIAGIINIIVKKDHTLPYGPFLSMAALLCLFYGNKIMYLLFALK